MAHARKLIRVCCVCKKSEDNGVWDHHDHHKEAIKKDATHGFCPPCFKDQKLELRKQGYRI